VNPGSKGAGKGAHAKESSSAGKRKMAIPFPPGISYLVAEEPLSVPHFTVREQEVGGWMAEGKTDAEIARILGISIETVRTHIKAMREKVKAENRNAFVAWVWRNRFAFYFDRTTPQKPVKYK
jgi:DNA-binding CsgD family transcriptional regulator